MLDSITGEAKVYVHVNGKGDEKKVSYTTCIGSRKIDEKNWINLFVPASFSKKLQEDVPDLKDGESFDILIKKSWISPYQDKYDKVHPALFIDKAKIVK